MKKKLPKTIKKLTYEDYKIVIIKTKKVVQKRLCKPLNPVKIKLKRRFFYG